MPLLTIDQAYIAIAMTMRSLRGWISQDDGLDDSPSKLIWIAAGIALALAATVFAIAVFNDAKETVPDPVVPQP
jgi:hypothetical protein